MKPYITPSISVESLMTAFMVTNLLGLSSTISNPILYGYINANVQAAIIDHFKRVHRRLDTATQKHWIRTQDNNTMETEL